MQLGFAWRRRAEFWRKVAWGAAIVALLLASGFAQVLLGLIGDTAFRLFPKELPTRAVPQIIEGSIMFRPEKFGQLVAIAGLCGALLHAVFDVGRMRAFAAGAALVIAVIAMLGIAQVYFSLPGAPPIYYEFAVWAVYPIFAISVVAWIWRFVRSMTSLSRFHAGPRVRIWAGLFLPVLAAAVLNYGNLRHHRHNPLPNVYPPKATPIVEFLRSEVGVSPDGPYRGRVVTMTGQNLSPRCDVGADVSVRYRLAQSGRQRSSDDRVVVLRHPDSDRIQPDADAADLRGRKALPELSGRSAISKHLAYAATRT